MKTSEERMEAAAPPAPNEERARILRGVGYCALVFLGMRAGLTLLGLLAAGLLPGLEPVGVPGWPARPTTPGWHNVVTAFERFDALWFLRIATDGYRAGDGSAAFFPGYPLLIRGISPLLGGHPLAAALLVSNLSAFGALVVLYFLTAGEFDEGVSRRAVLYLAVFPTAFFLMAPYSESPFLVLTLVSLWGARRGRWAVAGLAGAAAAATRNLGLLLVVPLLVEAVRQLRQGHRPSVVPVAWSILPAAGTLAYLGYWALQGAGWLAPVEQQATWERTQAFPLVTVVRGTYEAFRYPGHYPGGYHLMDWLVVAPALAAAVWVAFRTPLPYGAYTWLSVLAPLAYAFAPRPFMSLPRFLVVVFPILWAPAVAARRRPWIHPVVVAASGALLGIMTVLFVGWYYVF